MLRGEQPRGRLLASYLRACRGREILLVLRDGRVLGGELLAYRQSYALRNADAVVIAARTPAGAAVAVSLSLNSAAAIIAASPSGTAAPRGSGPPEEKR